MATTVGTQLGALTHRPQRQLLVALIHHNPQDDTPFDGGEPEIEDEELEVLYDFQHYHLPELESKGFIEYNREEHTISTGPNFAEIEPILALIDEHKDELPDDWL